MVPNPINAFKDNKFVLINHEDYYYLTNREDIDDVLFLAGYDGIKKAHLMIYYTNLEIYNYYFSKLYMLFYK